MVLGEFWGEFASLLQKKLFFFILNNFKNSLWNLKFPDMFWLCMIEEKWKTPQEVKLLKFSFSEKATKIWKNLQFVSMLQSKKRLFRQNRSEIFSIFVSFSYCLNCTMTRVWILEIDDFPIFQVLKEFGEDLEDPRIDKIYSSGNRGVKKVQDLGDQAMWKSFCHPYTHVNNVHIALGWLSY